MKQAKKLVNIRMSETLAEALREESERLEIGQSQFVRDAIRDKIARLKRAEQNGDQFPHGEVVWRAS